jgi:tetratricopeptide (TPR) repeat protein
MSQSTPRSRWTTRLIVAALCVAGAFSLPATVIAQTASGNNAVYELVEQGRQALIAEKYSEASKLFEQAIKRPEFADADSKLQYFAFLLGSFAAEGIDDNLTAHEYLVVATRHPDADGETWLRRARTAVLLEKWTDAAESLTNVTKEFPQTLTGDRFQSWLINKAVRELGLNPRLRAQRTGLLDALYEAGYKTQYGTEPSHLWLLMATDAVERNDIGRAREVSRRITDSSVLIAMRIDKRFDALIKEDPKLFDVRAAAEREARQLKTVVKQRPKSLGAQVQYGYALFTLGQFDEMLALANRAIARVEKAPADSPPYEDLDDSLNWIYNHKSLALTALGRWDEAVQVLADWERSDRNKEDKVSQAINLGFLYNELGRPDEALKVVNALDWSRGMSEYGRTQCQYVRFQAFHQQGKEAEVRDIVTWMREHQKDSLETAQATLLEAGDNDGAAALMITRLRDADDRAAALAEIQDYARTQRTERRKKLDALYESMLARADVAAAIAEVGRRAKFPVYVIQY